MKIAQTRPFLSSLESSLDSSLESVLFKTLAAMPQMVSYLSRDLEYLYINPAYEKFFELKTAETIGKKLFDVMGEKSFETARPYLERAFSGEEITYERDLPNPRGGSISVEVRYIPDFDSNSEGSKKVQGVIAILRDRSNEVSLDQKFHTIIETMSEGYVKQTASGEIISFNPAALAILELTESQLLGRTSYDPNWKAIKESGEPFPGEEHPVPIALKTGKQVSGVIMGLKLPDGTQKWISINATPIETSEICNGKVLEGVPANRQAICTFSDVTAIILNQRELKRRGEVLSTIFENSPVGIIQLNSDLKFVMANSAYQELVGYTEAELKNLKLLDITHPEDCASTLSAVPQLNSGTPLKFFEKRYIHKSGKVIWARVSSRVIQFEGSNEMNYFSAVEDVSEARENEQKLNLERDRFLRAAERFRAIFNSNPNPVLVFSENGIFDCNPAALTILGARSKDEILYKHPALFSPEIQPDGSSSKAKAIEMDELARAQGVHRFEWTHRRLDGSDFIVEVTMAPIGGMDSKSMLVLWNDLTEKKQKDWQLMQKSKLASLGEMSAGVAHEINNPLAIISGTIKILPKIAGDPEKFHTKIASIEKSIERISKIVLGLKKFSRTSEKKQSVPCQLSKIISEVVDLTQTKTRLSFVELSVECKTDALILGNEIEIEQILINLIHNAVEAIDGLKQKWIRIRLYEEGQEIVLQLRDSGPGIPESVRTKLFEPFFTTKPIGKGTGLGLAIVKGILDEHQATIEILSKEPNTCFEIRFPAYNKLEAAA